MKILRNLMFTLFAVAGLALSVSAQKDDKDKRPPKTDPPKIPAPDKNKPRENPKDDKKPKKPGMGFLLVIDERRTESV